MRARQELDEEEAMRRYLQRKATHTANISKPDPEREAAERTKQTPFHKLHTNESAEAQVLARSDEMWAAA